MNRTDLRTTLGLFALVAALLAIPTRVAAAAALSLTVTVPEPATAALLATGLVGLAVEAKRRRKK